MNTKLIAALILGSFVLAGCGGGGGGSGDTTTSMSDPAGSPLSFASLVNGQIVPPGTYHLVGASDAFLEALGDVEVPADGYAPDSMISVGGVSLRCTSDNSANCNIAVHEDGSFTTMGTIATVLAGGEFPMTAAERLIAEERARADAEQARADAAEAARQQEQAEREQAEQEAEEAAARARRADARAAHTGLRGTAATGTVAVTPRYNAVADVSITSPSVNFAGKSLSSADGWSVTTLSNAGFTHNDDLIVYSNRGPATRLPLVQEDSRFTDSAPDTANTPIQATMADTDEALIRSGSFPTTDGENKNFPNNFENDDTSEGPDIVRISGTFRGASGHFQCATQPCTIGRRGDRYDLVAGTWTFHATDAARILVDDRSYVYFGWWKREQKSDESLTFQTFYDVTDANSATTGAGANFNLLGGGAIYRGTAIGQYAIYQPLGAQSDSGSFTASAELSADFANNMLSGNVTGFSNDPDWSLTLNAQSMAGGNVSGGAVDWTIAGNTSRRQGAWEAEFFSESAYVGQVPDAVVGGFTAIYDGDTNVDEDVGRIVGVFGARK